MGCGRGAVFSIRPDWSRYAFLVEWESADAAQAFYRGADWQRAEKSAGSQHHLLLQPFHSKGLWDGKPRFSEKAGPLKSDLMAVITRADLKPWKLRSFFSYARKATLALNGQQGLRFSLGMGEWPFVRQATFSIWDSAEAMKGYAYQNQAHIDAMRSKNQQRWYGEEMYARFGILKENRESASALWEQTNL
jgi:hypothetical protein